MTTTVETLAELVRGELLGDRSVVVHEAAAIDKAGSQDVTFVSDEANFQKIQDCRAGAVVIGKALSVSLPTEKPGRAFVVVDDAQAAFLKVLEHFRPRPARANIGISADAFVSPAAKIGANTNVFSGAYISDDVTIGENCDIHPHVYIGPNCRLADDVVLYPGVVLVQDVELGSRVIVQSAAVIGTDGFGYRFEDGRHQKLPHFGTVRVEDDVEIGAGTTIDRAMIGATVIGAGTKLDNLVMIGHNCELGRHNVIVAQVAMAGSVTTGDYVVCAGQVGVKEHVHLGEGCTLGSKAGAAKDVPPGQTYVGVPAYPADEAFKVVMAQRRLPEMRGKVRTLEKQVAELTAKLDEMSALLKTVSKAAA